MSRPDTPLLGTIDTPEPWRTVVAELKGSEGAVLVIGASDTGKTTFCRWLVEELSREGRKVAWVDGDIGQSTIGPPTTIGVAIFEKGSPSPFEEAKPLFMRFVGSTSPVGHLLQTLVATKKMVDRSLQLGAQVVVVDTTGLVSGDIGRELKFQKVDLICPRHILALERADELEEILAPHLNRSQISVYRLQVSSRVKTKSVAERQRNRESRFNGYFQDGRIRELPFKDMGLHGMVPKLIRRRDAEGLLIGLCDQLNDTLALGIIEDIDLKGKLLSIYTPLQDLGEVRSIQFGSIRLDSEGKELGKARTCFRGTAKFVPPSQISLGFLPRSSAKILWRTPWPLGRKNIPLKQVLANLYSKMKKYSGGLYEEP